MLLTSIRTTIVLLLLTCGLYPLAVTGLGQLLFPAQAAGSLLQDASGRVVGSRLIGQDFHDPAWLHGRPSAAGSGYDAQASSGSNLGLYNPRLAERRAADSSRLQAQNPDAIGPVPEALLAASGSGLDPHLPPEAARWQLPRVAAARGVDLARVEALLDELIEARALGLLGEPTVNVLAFNLALDRRFPLARQP